MSLCHHLSALRQHANTMTGSERNKYRAFITNNEVGSGIVPSLVYLSQYILQKGGLPKLINFKRLV